MTITIRSRITWPTLFGELGAELLIYRNDALDVDQVWALAPARIVLSPGPGTPENARDFGICREILEHISPAVPTLGICLGHQGIAIAYGGRICRAQRVVHGKVSRIYHDGTGIFAGLPQGFPAGRYHSLAIDRRSLPGELAISALSEDGEIMAVRHKKFPITGVQFHPESILTECGMQLLQNFLYNSLEEVIAR